MSLLSIVLSFFIGFVSALEQPSFKGGKDALASFLKNNQVYPSFSKDNCIQGKVFVSFKLNLNGKVYSSEIEKGTGVDLDKEALRLIRLSSGKWIIPSGYDTTQNLVLPISFSLSDYRCEQRDKDQIKEAILAYKNREELAKVVTNYYASGDSLNSSIDENAILAIKEQLGLDDKYLKELLKVARRKLKQGDKESACEDFLMIKNFGSVIADMDIKNNCD